MTVRAESRRPYVVVRNPFFIIEYDEPFSIIRGHICQLPAIRAEYQVVNLAIALPLFPVRYDEKLEAFFGYISQLPSIRTKNRLAKNMEGVAPSRRR